MQELERIQINKVNIDVHASQMVQNHRFQQVDLQEVMINQLFDQSRHLIKPRYLIDGPDLTPSIARSRVENNRLFVVGPEDMFPIDTFSDFLAHFDDHIPDS
jgi:hypothetical protein